MDAAGGASSARRVELGVAAQEAAQIWCELKKGVEKEVRPLCV